MASDLEKQLTKRKPLKCFRCRYEDHLIAKFPKYNKKEGKQVRFIERGNRSSQKKCENVDNDNDQKIYAYMARMSDNVKIPSRDLSYSLQLTNWILYSGAMCHMTPQVSDFIPGSL